MANNESKHKNVAAEKPSFNYETIKSGFDDCEEVEVTKEEQESFEIFKKECDLNGDTPDYDNFQSWIHEPYYEDLQRRLTREYEEEDRKHEQYEWEAKLKEDGYRKVTLSIYGKEPMERWVMRSSVPLKDNYLLFCFDGKSEVFELIEDEDLPTYEFYLFKNDEEVEYTSVELEQIQNAQNDPKHEMNLHRFRTYCRESGMEDYCRNYLKYIENKEGKN